MQKKFFYYQAYIPLQAETIAFMASTAARGVTLVEPYVTRLNFAYYYAKQQPVYAKLDCWYNFKWVSSGYSEADRQVIVNTDIKDPSKVATLHNPYTGCHVAGVGYIGNSTDFGVLTEFIPSAGVNYTQNDGIYGYLALANSGKAGSWTISGIDSGFTKYCEVVPEELGETYRMFVNVGNSTGTVSYDIPRAYNHRWRRGQRFSSTSVIEYDNGMPVSVNSDPSSTLPSTKVGLLGIYSGSWFSGAAGYTPSRIGGYYAGGNGLDADQFEHINNTFLNNPVGGDGAFDKLILAMGDSIFGPQTSGIYSRMYQTAISTLNDKWGLTNLSASGKWAADFDTQYNTYIVGHFRPDYLKYPVHVCSGSNDLASGSSATTVYNKIKSQCNKLLTDGFTDIMISGVLDRTASLLISQAAFDSERAALKALMLADFPTAHGSLANFTTPTGTPYASVYFNPDGDTTLDDSTNATIFPDNVHLSTVGNDYYATDVFVPYLQTL